VSDPNQALVKQYGPERAKRIQDLLDEQARCAREILREIGEALQGQAQRKEGP